MVTKHETDKEAAEMFLKSFEEARLAGRWMAAVWVVQDDKITMSRRTTFKFPRGDFLRSTAQFSEHCADEDEENSKQKDGATERPGPLPRANPDIKVFSMEGADEEKEPVLTEVPPPVVPPVSPPGFPNPTPPSLEQVQEKLARLPEVTVERAKTAVILSAEGSWPQLLPVDVTEVQITEAVEAYRAGLGASL